MGKRLRFSRHSLLIASAVLTLSLLAEAAKPQDRAKLEIVAAIGIPRRLVRSRSHPMDPACSRELSTSRSHPTAPAW